MPSSAADGILLVAITANGLLAGVYLAFSVAVSPALRRLDARTHVRSAVAVNRAILNPVFLALFVGAPLSAVAAVATSPGAHSGPGIAAIGCSVLALVVTVTVNVPLNRALERADPRDGTQASAIRERFARPWDLANVVRAAASVAAALALGWIAIDG